MPLAAKPRRSDGFSDRGRLQSPCLGRMRCSIPQGTVVHSRRVQAADKVKDSFLSVWVALLYSKANVQEEVQQSHIFLEIQGLARLSTIRSSFVKCHTLRSVKAPENQTGYHYLSAI